MSQNAKNFINKLQADPALKARVFALYKKKQTSEIEKIAKEAGTPCSLKEIEEQVKASKLTDADLLQITGGAGDDKPDIHRFQ